LDSIFEKKIEIDIYQKSHKQWQLSRSQSYTKTLSLPFVEVMVQPVTICRRARMVLCPLANGRCLTLVSLLKFPLNTLAMPVLPQGLVFP
jgi:hypothetical protein